MNEQQKTKIEVPDGMLKVALGAVNSKRTVHCPACSLNELNGILEAALLWQRDHVPVPSSDQWNELAREWWGAHRENGTPRELAVEWIKRMYDVPESQFEQKEVFFNKPGDYYVHVPASGAAPEVGPIESFGHDRAHPNAPKNIRDLLEWTADLPSQQLADIKGIIIEAYRRGKGHQ